jgi:hypothetical protein
MKNRFILILIFAGLFLANDVYGKKIHNKPYKFEMVLPETTVNIKDTTGQGDELLYFDTEREVVLIISARVSKFSSVKDYMDCSSATLEQNLQTSYGDTNLRMISCDRSDYYPDNTTVLHFRVGDGSNSLDTYIIYFIHFRKEDIQISFAYAKEAEQKSIGYVSDVMKTLKLK